MKRTVHVLGILALLALCSVSCGKMQGAGEEWDRLRQDAEALYDQGQYDQAVKVAGKALQILERTLGPSHPDVLKLAEQRDQCLDRLSARQENR